MPDKEVVERAKEDIARSETTTDQAVPAKGVQTVQTRSAAVERRTASK
jgi:hypothetical protein